MQIPVSVGRLRIVIYYVRRGSRTGPRAHAGVPTDHFSYQRSLRARGTLRPACPRFVDFTRVVGICICSLLRSCSIDLSSFRRAWARMIRTNPFRVTSAKFWLTQSAIPVKLLAAKLLTIKSIVSNLICFLKRSKWIINNSILIINNSNSN